MGVTVVTTKVMLKQDKQNATYNPTLYCTYVDYKQVVHVHVWIEKLR